MAGVARKFPLAVEYCGVEGYGHRDHASSDVLFPFVIHVELSDRVTIPTANSEGECDVFHRGMNFGGGNILQDFNLFIELRRGLALHIFGCGRGSGRSRRRWTLRV